MFSGLSFLKATDSRIKREKATSTLITAQRGFSLVELILVIGILTVIASVGTVGFLRYVERNRQRACKANREAVVNVFVSCVYNDVLDSTTTDIQKVLNNPEDIPTNSFTKSALREVERYNSEKNAHRSFYTAEVTEYTSGGRHRVCSVTCSECGNRVELDVADWSTAVVEEGLDTFTGKTPWETKEPYDPEVTPVAEVTPTPTVDWNLDYWPYQDSSRWDTAGAYVGRKIVVECPSGIQISKSGTRYVLVGSKDGGTYNIEYEKAISPEYLFVIDEGHIVVLSGRELTEKDAQYRNNNRDEMWFSDVSYGDMVTVRNKNTGKEYKYVCWGRNPQEGSTKISVYSVGNWSIGDWTRVDRD